MRRLIDWNSSKIYKALARLYIRLLKIRGEPKEIALGFALGIFIGMTPTIGFQMAIAIPLASLLTWNKISAAIGVWISNPLTAPFIYTLTYYLGSNLLGLSEQHNVGAMISLLSDIPCIIWRSIIGKAPENMELAKTLTDILSQTSIFLWACAIGGVIVGLPLAVAAYYFSFSAVKKYQIQIRQKLAAQKAKLAHRKEEIIKRREERLKEKRKRQKKKKKRVS